MGKCETCEHYAYQAGVSLSLQKALGKTMPTEPTCFCNFAKVSWTRYRADVIKPRGIPCEYRPKEMECVDCHKKVKGKVWLVLTRETCVCQKCGKLKDRSV